MSFMSLFIFNLIFFNFILFYCLLSHHLLSILIYPFFFFFSLIPGSFFGFQTLFVRFAVKTGFLVKYNRVHGQILPLHPEISLYFFSFFLAAVLSRAHMNLFFFWLQSEGFWHIFDQKKPQRWVSFVFSGRRTDIRRHNSPGESSQKPRLDSNGFH